ncbi:TAXI family TRAP transporter solute-binding subunit [Chloroflexota bacterium]
MKAWLTRVAVVMLAVVFVASGCAPKPAAPAEHEKVNLEIYSTSAAGTPPYEYATILAAMLNELHPWLRGTPLETMGSVDAIHTTDALPLDRKKHVFLPITFTVSQMQAWLGVPPYKRQFTDLKLLAVFGQNGLAFATCDPNIKTPHDLVGKRLGFGPKVSAPYPLAEAILRDAWGILNQVKISEHKPPDLKDIMFSGVADAIYALPETRTGGKWKWEPAFYVRQIIGARKTYWVGLSPEDVKRINEKNPWDVAHLVMPKGVLGEDNPPTDVGLASPQNYFIAWDVADDEVVYELIRFLDENAAEWEKRTRGVPGGARAMGAFRGMTEDKVHPAALRYYKEKVIQIGG